MNEERAPSGALFSAMNDPQPARFGDRDLIAEAHVALAEAALRNRNTSFVIDGEAVLLGVDGRSDFNGLHSRRHDDEVQFYAFDILAEGGEDLRKLPLSLRRPAWRGLLARRVDGIFLSDFEQGAIGPQLFEAACKMELEGIVSKHGGRWYGAGPCSHWIQHPAYRRVQDQF
ncbi:hypothetical protein [Bradyrhizobium elkanii]|uniref:ATP-dependent DNA ligase n=1 Tax=Bradyrhizobium elkanii TaxID=29448 RepID=UPI000427EB33|nr:hypothetical protein [Bradyrhizobium elkanii]